MKPKVVVAEALADSGIELMSESCEVDVAAGLERSELMTHLKDAVGLVVRSATKVDKEMLDAAPNLKVIGRAGVGVDNIDVSYATQKGVLVVNAPNANTVSAAEQAMALLLAQARNLAPAHAKLVAGVWDRKSFSGVELHGKTMGVVGLGKIGTLVAQRCLGFGMQLLAHDPFVTEERARRLGVELVPLDDLVARADFISIHLPKNKDTLGLFGAETLAKCKKGVRIINTSRGGIVDEAALAEAIKSGHIGGAGLDVFEKEPTTESPLFGLDKVVVTPHLGASTAEAQDKAGTDVAEAVAAALRGELVLSAVNVDLGREVSDEVRANLELAEQLGRTVVGLGKGLSGTLTIRAEGRIAANELQPLKLAVLKGALEKVSTEPVSYVNAPALAEQRGINIELVASEEAVEYVSLIKVSTTVDGNEISVAGSISRKGPMMVEILGHDAELPFSKHVLIVRNDDKPGAIGRVGTYLGELGVNIANMVVGRSQTTGEAALMGLNIDTELTTEQVEGFRALPGIVEAHHLELA